MQTVTVDLGDRAYPIYIDERVLTDRHRMRTLLDPLVRGKQVAILSNSTVHTLYGLALQEVLEGLQADVFLMQDGEQFKSLETYAQFMDFLMANRHNRTTCIIALGGGVVGDLAGFAAATFQRGVDFVQIPTTLLAQVDSSVGGKTAVNHAAGKNMIGAFYQPKAVVIDTLTVRSLPAREYAAGLAEVVKYGVIADAAFFAWLEDHVEALLAREPDVLRLVIQRCCEVKAQIVAQDEREGGVRALLNFGHTFGHAIENLAGYGQWLHGEAVAVGMVMAARFSERLLGFPRDHSERLERLLQNLQLPVRLHNAMDHDEIVQAMGMDKKAFDGQLRFIVSRAIGQAQVIDDYDATALTAVLEEFC